MKTHMPKNLLRHGIASLLLFMALFVTPLLALAKDTDLYTVNVKQNAYVLMDSSGSMAFGVYEHNIDYAAMFDYLFALNDSPVGDYGDYIYDTVNNSNYFYQQNKATRTKIYLWKGRIGVTIANVDGNQVMFTGDAADPNYLWFSNDMIDTHTLIDDDGNLSHDGSGFAQRITVNAAGRILLDGELLPLNQNIKLHDPTTMYDGSVVDHGFGGLIRAPGYHFSGYEGVTAGSHDVVESGDQDIYFFVAGNWANMQAMYNLHYTTNNPTPAGAQTGDAAWRYETFPLVAASWTQLDFNLDYPAGAVNYTNNLTEAATVQNIVHAGAQKMQVHFSAFGVQGNNNANTFTKDYVKLYDKTGAVVGQYDNDNPPTASNSGWSAEITGDTATLKLSSDNATTGAGYTIDKIRVVYVAAAGGSYLMQDRLSVAKDAMVYVVDYFRGKMNWGFASFANGANGATIGPYLNPTDNDDTNRAAILQQISNVSATGGTPLMEALQDVFESGYYGRRNILDNMACRKNYIISMTDGYPSLDTDNTRISGVTFADWDGDAWTSDPYQPPTSPNYYDDVGHWIYTHSWKDKSLIADPANSYYNVITHHIAFGSKHPLLEDAAGESGGEYIVAYNKEQLVSAFYSLGLMMTRSIAFTAPVVSVDAVNKLQSGDDLYMGLFLPKAGSAWVGNLKKFKLGDGSAQRPKKGMIYDGANQEALDVRGSFKDNLSTFWGDDTDTNDSDNYGAADVEEDGAGEVLLEDVTGFFGATTYWNRPIYTSKAGAMVKFTQANISAADLNVADTDTRNKLVNYTHGYTYDAVATAAVDGSYAPVAVRDWVLGSIIHSQPVVVDYYDTASPLLPLQKRLVAVGSNDGMLHIFDDTTGEEVFAFIPEDILPQLKNVQANPMWDTVDGSLTLYRRDNIPKYLIFGERRGGKYYWCLDVHDQNPLNWTVAWSYTNAELKQSWSEVRLASIQSRVEADGTQKYKDVAIFTGGYDDEEDNFPEPFNDADMSGSPYQANGSLDNTEWSQADAAQDVNNNNNYDEFNPDKNEFGRGIYVVDINNPTTVTSADDGNQILPFSVSYGAATLATGPTQTSADMKFSFPAGPNIILDTDKFFYTVGGVKREGIKTNVLRAIYAIDVYATIFKVSYDLNATDQTKKWLVNKLFSANPGSASGSGRMGGADDVTDQGRKAFYPPEISWGGSGTLFNKSNLNYFISSATNYYYKTGTDKIASLFFGTGDREHPKYRIIRNRFYAVYDDSSVSAKECKKETDLTDRNVCADADDSFVRNIPLSSAPYTEKNLLNVTCDELGADSVINNCYLGALGGACDAANIDTSMKTYLKSLLRDDVSYDTDPALTVITLALEEGAAHENDAKGWYIILEDQGSASVCSHVTYSATVQNALIGDRDNHQGEHVLSMPLLFAKNLYFTTYQPAAASLCDPQQGNGFAYSLNYLNGGAALNLNAANGGNLDLTDRYGKFGGIYGIGSGFTIIFDGSETRVLANMGDQVIGPAGAAGGDDDGDGKDNSEIPGIGSGIELYYWRLGN